MKHFVEQRVALSSSISSCWHTRANDPDKHLVDTTHVSKEYVLGQSHRTYVEILTGTRAHVESGVLFRRIRK
jgi:hypothetical protein